LKSSAFFKHCGGSVAPANRQNTDKYRTRFKPGQSGNPSGRPKGAGEFRKTVEAFLHGKLDPKTTVLQDILHRLRVEKPEVLLHYAFGKPTEHVEIDAADSILGLAGDILSRARDYARVSRK